MTTIVDKIRKRIRTQQMLEKKIIKQIQITKKESEELKGKKEIDGVELIVVGKLGNTIKTNCFAYIERGGHKSCYGLKKLYCMNQKCNFYKQCDYKGKDNMLEIEKDIKKYYKLKEVK